MQLVSNGAYRELLGRKIKVLRKEAGLRQEDLRHMLGYDSATMISLIESGKKGMSMEKLARAAEVFNVNEAFLLSRKPLNDEQIQMIINLNRVVEMPESPIYALVKNVLDGSRELLAVR
jgi:transcriptional regulator with XRE-family HTH domain